MNKQHILDQFRLYGLDEIEAKIYLHLLQSGSLSPLNLSREISINRSRIYRYIDKLVSKKLVELIMEGRGKKLKASDPGNLELLFQEKEHKAKMQREILPDLLKELIKLPAMLEKEFELRHYYGIEGIRQMLWNHLLASDRQILAYSYQNRNEMVGKSFAEKIREEQVLRKIKLYEIENETDQGDYWYTDVSKWGKYYNSRYIPPEILMVHQYIGIVNNTVSLINWHDKEFVGIEIENKTYAGTQRQMFWKFWDIAHDYVAKDNKIEQNKKLKPNRNKS